MPNYEDRRGRYNNVAPWEVGKIKEKTLAARDSSWQPFRFTTAEIPPPVPTPPAVEVPVNPVPTDVEL